MAALGPNVQSRDVARVAQGPVASPSPFPFRRRPARWCNDPVARPRWSVSTLRFVGTLLGTAAAVWVVAGAYVLFHDPPHWDGEPAMAVLGGTFAGLVAVFFQYVGLYVYDVLYLGFPADQLRESERVLLASSGIVAHHIRTWLRSRESTSGRLFLTDQRIVFVTFRFQLWRDGVSVELGDVSAAEAGTGLLTGFLRLMASQGPQVFSFGILRHLEAE